MLVFRGKNINIAPKKGPFLSGNPMFIPVSRGPTRVKRVKNHFEEGKTRLRGSINDLLEGLLTVNVKRLLMGHVKVVRIKQIRNFMQGIEMNETTGINPVTK
jgi:hypothetical protein